MRSPTVKNATRTAAKTAAGDNLRLKPEFNRLLTDLERIKEISSGIIYMIDVEGRFTFINRAVEDLLHYTPEELIGQHFSTIVLPMEIQRISREFVLPHYKGQLTGPDLAPKLFNERRTHNRKTRNLEIQLVAKENRESKILIGDITGILSSEGAYSPAPEKSNTGNREPVFIGSQGIIYDITRYKEIENEKTALEEHLLEVERLSAVGRFGGNIAHELNNKMSTIIGFADIVKKKYAAGNPDLAGCLNSIIDTTQSAGELSGRLLEFIQDPSYAMAQVDLDAIIQRMAKLLRHIIAKQLQVTYHCHAKTSVITGNATELQNALLNLIMRLSDLMTDTGDIMLALRSITIDQNFIEKHSLVGNYGEYLVITLICSGIGDESAACTQFFNILMNSDRIADSAKSGLATVHQCLKGHRGFLEVVREQGKGTRIDLYFPAKGYQDKG
jgi:signal transduction histidine kinase